MGFTQLLSIGFHNHQYLLSVEIPYEWSFWGGFHIKAILLGFRAGLTYRTIFCFVLLLALLIKKACH